VLLSLWVLGCFGFFVIVAVFEGPRDRPKGRAVPSLGGSEALPGLSLAVSWLVRASLSCPWLSRGLSLEGVSGTGVVPGIPDLT